MNWVEGVGMSDATKSLLDSTSSSSAVLKEVCLSASLPDVTPMYVANIGAADM
jgi:hypothetical protein